MSCTVNVGSVLSGGGSVPGPKASAEAWVNLVNGIQKASLSTRLGIPMIYGIDAVHGHSNVYNATIFPHNVGLGVTRQVFFFLFNFEQTRLSYCLIFENSC
jgi:beta-glucosidase-like glycosyl hydrolase